MTIQCKESYVLLVAFTYILGIYINPYLRLIFLLLLFGIDSFLYSGVNVMVRAYISHPGSYADQSICRVVISP